MPTVSVITPFHNTAKYLRECIESVLAQTMGDFEYLLVDNASTDHSLEIAQEYAGRDARIRVVHFDELVPQIPNYNRALRLADPQTRYCKIVQADDAIMPHCLDDMVELADSDEAIGLVGAYTLLQRHVFLDGLDYYERVVDGDELCRRYFLDGPYIFGNPTSQLYRTADVLAMRPFFDERSLSADADVAARLVLGRKFGFVHQVLSFARRDNESISSAHETFNINILTRRVLLEKYGRKVLDADTFAERRRTFRRRHYQVLGEGWLTRQGTDFWDFHRRGLAEGGLEISRKGIAAGVALILLRRLLNPEMALRQLLQPKNRRRDDH